MRRNDPYLELRKELTDLKVGFNGLNDQVRLLKSHLSAVEESLNSLKSFVNAIKHEVEIELVSVKTYAKAVSKIEAAMAVRNAQDHVR